MTKEEALRKVLVTLEWFEERKHLNQFDWQTQHIADIKEALAQPEQKPVAWEQFHEHLVERNFCQRCGKRTADIHTCTPPQ